MFDPNFAAVKDLVDAIAKGNLTLSKLELWAGRHEEVPEFTYRHVFGTANCDFLYLSHNIIANKTVAVKGEELLAVFIQHRLGVSQTLTNETKELEDVLFSYAGVGWLRNYDQSNELNRCLSFHFKLSSELINLLYRSIGIVEDHSRIRDFRAVLFI